MVLEKQDSGISLTEGADDNKMADDINDLHLKNGVKTPAHVQHLEQTPNGVPLREKSQNGVELGEKLDDDENSVYEEDLYEKSPNEVKLREKSPNRVQLRQKSPHSVQLRERLSKPRELAINTFENGLSPESPISSASDDTPLESPLSPSYDGYHYASPFDGQRHSSSSYEGHSHNVVSSPLEYHHKHGFVYPDGHPVPHQNGGVGAHHGGVGAHHGGAAHIHSHHEGEEHVPLHKTVCCALCRKKQERQKRKEKSSSFSDVSSIASSSRSSLSPWLRDPAQEARPITNPTLRKTLYSAKSGTRVTPRDQKILELMMQKGEQAKATKRNSDIARSNWELERQQEAKARKAAEIRRRHSIQEGRKAKDMQRASSETHVAGRLSRHGSRGSVDCDHDGYRHRDVERRRVNGFSSHHHDHDHEDDGKGCDRGMHSPSQKQLELKRRQAEEKRLQNVAKQKAAEERIKQQQRDKEEFAAAIKEKQQRDLNRASSMKEAKEKEIILKTKLKNFHARKKSEERLSQIRKQKEEELEGLKAVVALKQMAADQRLQEDKDKKDTYHRRSQRELSKKLELSKKSQKQLDEEMEEWKKDLLSYRKMQEQRAEEIAQEKLKEKKRKAHEERIAKESKAKENMKKMLEQEEEWRADVEATIAMKDAKSKMLQMEKEEMIEESRALAQASQQLREELRSHYAKDNLETLNRQAELETKIINKGMSGIKLS